MTITYPSRISIISFGRLVHVYFEISEITCLPSFEPIKGLRGVERLAKYVNIFQNPKKRDRVKFYHSNCRIFRHSKGIVYPPTEKMTYADAKKLVEGMKLQNKERFSVNVVSVDGETAKIQGIQKEVYI